MKKKKQVKYIFVVGGVISGLGKGIAASSIGYLLKSAGLKVTGHAKEVLEAAKEL